MTGIVELLQLYPRTSIILLSVLVSLFITIIQFFFLNKDRLREIKARQKDLQKQMSEHRKAGNHDKVLELNKELTPLIMETFKHSLKPTIITMIPILIFFAFIRGVYVDTAIAGSWFWWYLIAALASSIVLRKLFRLP